MGNEIVINDVQVKSCPRTAVCEVEIHGQTVTCNISGSLRMQGIEIKPGDIVDVELSPYDLTRGRIIAVK